VSGRPPSRSPDSALVYSTDSGVLRVSRETKGRAGKGVTVVRGLPLAPDALAALGKQLRTACGAGGTVKDGAVEVQGDHCERVMTWLAQQGWTVKRTGG
jgi:translation initiation factor 1